jgi:hypothetical protein
MSFRLRHGVVIARISSHAAVASGQLTCFGHDRMISNMTLIVHLVFIARRSARPRTDAARRRRCPLPRVVRNRGRRGDQVMKSSSRWRCCEPIETSLPALGLFVVSTATGPG